MLNYKITRTFLTAVLALSAATSAFAKTYEHSLGSVEINDVPKRVVVLGYGSLDFLTNLGVKPIATTKKLLPEHLSQYRGEHITNTGSMFEVNYETLFELKPDLIIAENRQGKLYKDLSQIAPTYMYSVDNTNYWKTTSENWKVMGEIFGEQEKAQQMIDTVQARIDEVGEEVKSEPRKTMAIMSVGNKLSMFHTESRLSFIYKDLGFLPADKAENVKSEAKKHGALISFEYIADAQPDMMFVLDKDQAVGRASGKAKERFDNDLVKSTPAYKNDSITYLQPVIWYVTAGGYQSTLTMLDDVEGAL
ncbi:ABC transporter substrate-binding protein [Vibrio sp. D404a]|uniref:siderophore ABC transporter substrate-binding protein n=1 Tax=unclassified Vibrio TaxID=2614977 RepID=UPI002552DB3A|nr:MULTISPECIES: ABC transporter substrate-binding protein [unclassified Vibrio]MDK9735748.1 ABC transporter substrate-binding protein [Vibrio sp. D404a]MDK9798664.1 ABC transporter substrate-binding protein [Vibrio sp. D449a]